MASSGPETTQRLGALTAASDSGGATIFPLGLGQAQASIARRPLLHQPRARGDERKRVLQRETPRGRPRRIRQGCGRAWRRADAAAHPQLRQGVFDDEQGRLGQRGLAELPGARRAARRG